MAKTNIKAEQLDTNGPFDHMTVDEINDRLIGHSRKFTCPLCGRIHLSEDDVKAAAKRLVSESRRYKAILLDAMHNPGQTFT